MTSNILWTGESVWCQCGHSVESHTTFNDGSVGCEWYPCPCPGFKAYKTVVARGVNIRKI